MICVPRRRPRMTEPGAGSDVSGVQMRAVRYGDEWILNGTKVSGSYTMQRVFRTLINCCAHQMWISNGD